ncbi:MAG: toxin-antitoxin system YwqK family antitoxin [Aeoliella sp.]
MTLLKLFSIANSRPIVRSYRTAGAVSCAVIILSAAAVAQELVDGGDEDETPAIVPQRESVTIEAYSGPPIFLPDPPPTVAAKEIESTKHTEYYNPEEKKNPRIERSIVRYSDESIKNHGPYREYYETGQVFLEGRYDRGEPTGDWTYFHENGAEAKVVTFEGGLPSGSVEYRRGDGTLQAKREFTEGKRTGTWLVYNDTGEDPIREEHYVDGKPDGLWQFWYPDGTKQRQSPFVDGQPHGTAIEWNEEGEKRAEVTFVDGKRHGKSHIWTLDGREIEQEYEKGKLVVTKVVSE